MISYAAILPHPPVMIPEVGGEEGVKKIEKTILSVLKIGLKVSEVQPEVMVLIGPHGVVYPDAVSVRKPKGGKLMGDFSVFGVPDLRLEFESDAELVSKISDSALGSNISVIEIDDGRLDHGVLVPMYYLSKSLAKTPRLVVLNMSLKGYESHFKLGEAMFDALEKDKRSVMVVASSDLSHSLSSDAPAGYNSQAEAFDKDVLGFLEGNNVEHFLGTDSFLADEVGECGMRCISTLLGIVNNKGFKVKKYSYEAPYGVGYAVFGLCKG